LTFVSKRKRKASASETFFKVMGVLLAVSMIISLIIVALPGPPAATPTPYPTVTPLHRPSATPSSVPPEASPTPEPTTVSPTLEPTLPAAGPELPTATPTPEPTSPPVSPELPTATPTSEPTLPAAGPELPTATPPVTPTITPAGAIDASPAAATGGFTFAVCGDSRGHPEIYRRVLDAAAADGSEFLVHTGDLVSEGRENLWQKVQQVMADFSLPFYPVPGNHDSLDGKLDNYLQYSGAPAAHYSFDRPPLHLVMADSHNGGLSAAELTWLRENLAATTQPIKMVFLHHPPFDPDGTSHIMAYGNKPFMALMSEMKVDYVFAGHIHAYARGERDGVVYLYTGGAGAPLYTDGHAQAFHHYLRVTVQDGEVTVEVVEI
jgi:predicted phosphodiesterase